jgi:asparagine synthase (glutamine-hydrolysing)
MSGIAGIFSRTSEPVNPAQLGAMMNILAHRGRDRADVWREDAIGLVHRLLFTTPDSLYDCQPLQLHGCAITADARLDNREALASALSIDLSGLNATPDSHLILAAYLQWGRACVEHLLGDFAFAIWDARQKQVFCARDPFGVKPFYYNLSAGWFTFSSEIKGLLCLPQTPRNINEELIAKFLMPAGNLVDKESTFYAQIYRLPPAHSLVVSPSSNTMSCYWALDPHREIRFQDDEQYFEALREKFIVAVQRRMRSAYPVGSTLSGGLDSSSIACVARDLLAAEGKDPLHTYSAVYQNAPDADESQYINAVIDQGKVTPHILHLDTQSPFIDLERVIWHLDEPFFGTNYFMPWSFYRTANENGVRVLLDGTDGDTTISHGMDYLEMLAIRGDWKQFANEAHAVTRNFDHPRYASVPSIFYSYGAPQLERLARQGRWIRFAREMNTASALFNVPRKRLLMNCGIRPLISTKTYATVQKLRGRKVFQQPQIPNYVAPEFANQLQTQGFFHRDGTTQAEVRQNGRALHAHYLSLGMLPYSLEIINRLSSAWSVEMRYPFCDRELIEFSLALPPELKLRDGWGRYVMRGAMTGILPEAVQWRGGKISLIHVLPYMMHHYGNGYVEETLSNPPEPLSQYIHMPVIREMYQKFRENPTQEDPQWVWQTIIFATWMKEVRRFATQAEAGFQDGFVPVA